MAKRSLIDQLDDAVEAMMAQRDASRPPVDTRLAELLRIASDLVDLPSEEFKTRLKADLLQTGSAPIHVKPVPQGYHSATPCLVIRDAPGAIDFYKQAFGATELMRLADPQGHILHAEIEIGDSRIAIAGEATESGNHSPQSLGGSPVIIQLYVEDVDALASQAVAAGATVVFPVADQFYGDRAGRLADPFGHVWIVATHKEDVTPEEMHRRMEAFSHAQMPSSEEHASEDESAMAVPPIREGFRTITPYLQVEGAAKLIDFLKQAFDAQEILRVPRADGIAHAEMKIGDSVVEMADATPQFKPMPTAIHLYVDDADAVYRRALRAGATSMQEPTDQDYGDREAGVKDPLGNHWYIATHKGAKPIPEGLHNVMPYLHPHGAAALIDFLKRAFAAEEAFRAQSPDGAIHHAKIRIGDSVIEMGEAHGPYQPMPTAIHLYVADADAVYQRALQAGATSIFEPADQDYGDRTGGVEDPFGNVWYIATRKKDVAF